MYLIAHHMKAGTTTRIKAIAVSSVLMAGLSASSVDLASAKYWYAFEGNLDASSQNALVIRGRNSADESHFVTTRSGMGYAIDGSAAMPWGDGMALESSESAWTIVCSAKSVDTENAVIWMRGTAGRWNFALASAGPGKVKLANWWGTPYTVDAIEVPDASSKFHAYAFVREAGPQPATVKVYVDGELRQTVGGVANGPLQYSTDITSFQFGGCHGNPNNGMLDGAGVCLDDWRLFETALGEDDIKAYAELFPVSLPGPYYVAPDGLTEVEVGSSYDDVFLAKLGSAVYFDISDMTTSDSPVTLMTCAGFDGDGRSIGDVVLIKGLSDRTLSYTVYTEKSSDGKTLVKCAIATADPDAPVRTHWLGMGPRGADENLWTKDCWTLGVPKDGDTAVVSFDDNDLRIWSGGGHSPIEKLVVYANHILFRSSWGEPKLYVASIEGRCQLEVTGVSLDGNDERGVEIASGVSVKFTDYTRGKYCGKVTLGSGTGGPVVFRGEVKCHDNYYTPLKIYPSVKFEGPLAMSASGVAEFVSPGQTDGCTYDWSAETGSWSNGLADKSTSGVGVTNSPSVFGGRNALYGDDFCLETTAAKVSVSTFMVLHPFEAPAGSFLAADLDTRWCLGRNGSSASWLIRNYTWADEETTARVVRQNGVNGSLVKTEPMVVSTVNSGWLRGGGFGARTFFFGGRCKQAWGEMLAFNTALSPSVVTNIENSLMNKWGIDTSVFNVVSPSRPMTMSAKSKINLCGYTQTAASFTGAGVVTNGWLRTADGNVVQSGGALFMQAADGMRYEAESPANALKLYGDNETIETVAAFGSDYFSNGAKRGTSFWRSCGTAEVELADASWRSETDGGWTTVWRSEDPIAWTWTGGGAAGVWRDPANWKAADGVSTGWPVARDVARIEKDVLFVGTVPAVSNIVIGACSVTLPHDAEVGTWTFTSAESVVASSIYAAPGADEVIARLTLSSASIVPTGVNFAVYPSCWGSVVEIADGVVTVRAERSCGSFKWIGAAVADTASDEAVEPGGWADEANWLCDGVPAYTVPGEHDEAVFETNARVSIEAETFCSNIHVTASMRVDGEYLMHLKSVTGDGTLALGERTGIVDNGMTVVVDAGLCICGTAEKPTRLASYNNYQGIHIKGPLSGSGVAESWIGRHLLYTGTSFFGDASGFTGSISLPPNNKGRNLYAFPDADGFDAGNSAWEIWPGNLPNGHTPFQTTGALYSFGSLTGYIAINNDSVQHCIIETGWLGLDDELDGNYFITNPGLAPSRGHTLRKVGAGTLSFSGRNLRALEVNGGVLLAASADVFDCGDSVLQHISFGGGELKLAADVDYDVSAIISESEENVVFNDGGVDRTWASAISASNLKGFVKRGAGLLTLAQPPANGGGIELAEGGLRLPANTHTDVLALGNGVRLVLDAPFSATRVDIGGSLTLEIPSIPSDGKIADLSDGILAEADLTLVVDGQDVEGYTLLEQADGLYLRIPDGFDVGNGRHKYSTFPIAVQSARAGEKVLAIKDTVAPQCAILMADGVSIDLAGHQLVCQGKWAVNTGSNSVTIANGKILYTEYGVWSGEGELVLDGVTLSGAKRSVQKIGGGSLSVRNGSSLVVTANDPCIFAMGANEGRGSVTISDSAVVQQYAPFDGEDALSYAIAGNLRDGVGFDLAVSGDSEISSLATSDIHHPETTGGSVAISKGVFAHRPKLEHLVAGAYRTQLADGRWRVDVAPAAEVGGVEYATLQEALDAAGTGATVSLLRDIELSDAAEVAEGKSVVLDLAGRKLGGAEGGVATDLGYEDGYAFNAINVFGALRLMDSSESAGGNILAGGTRLALKDGGVKTYDQSLAASVEAIDVDADSTTLAVGRLRGGWRFAIASRSDLDGEFTPEPGSWRTVGLDETTATVDLGSPNEARKFFKVFVTEE